MVHRESSQWTTNLQQVAGPSCKRVQGRQIPDKGLHQVRLIGWAKGWRCRQICCHRPLVKVGTQTTTSPGRQCCCRHPGNSNVQSRMELTAKRLAYWRAHCLMTVRHMLGS